MLVRRPQDGSEIAIHQEQHALLSGVLAAAWRPSLHPRLIAAITLHDAPWRSIDSGPRKDPQGGIIDFVSYPIAERLEFYTTGIDELEQVDPYVAYMVSLHYSSFAGMAKMTQFRAAESERRARLQPLLGRLAADVARDLKWLQFFDVLSLHLCLTGPDVPTENLPVWLRDDARWSTAPDGRRHALEWTNAHTSRIYPFPFEESLRVEVVGWRDGNRELVEIVLEP